ncbi:MAG: hypothetical protein A3K23_02535 [Desulfobacca sp. RBG_16_58_9]|nr:MAG: hypothetical protein A3K23_02535 [Desulfobacca sp. RBG_16_58_9]
MGHPGHGAALAQAVKLQRQPQAQPDKGRDVGEFRLQPPEHHGEDGRLGQPRQVSPQHPGDGAAGPDEGDGQTGGGHDVEKTGKETAKEIEGQEAPRPQVVFQGLAEHPQEPHVADEMNPAGVQEQGTEHGRNEPNGLVRTEELGLAQLGGHRPLLPEEIVGRLGADIELVEIDRQVQGDEPQGDPGPPVPDRRPPYRDHVSSG